MNWPEITPLKIVEAGNPCLHQQARELTLDEILSPSIQMLIQLMKTTMRAAPGVGLAAPQIGIPLQIAVIEDRIEYHKFWTPEQLAERERRPIDFHVIINPKIFLDDSEGTVEFFEGCLSVPSLMGLVPRAKVVKVECLNEKGEPIVINARGWYARILQHEIDHLNGGLFLNHVHTSTLMTRENYDKFWKEKSSYPSPK